MSSAPILLAHQGGWDEILFVLVPIGVVIGLLALLKRRVERNLPTPAEDPAVAEPPAADEPSATS